MRAPRGPAAPAQPSSEAATSVSTALATTPLCAESAILPAASQRDEATLRPRGLRLENRRMQGGNFEQSGLEFAYANVRDRSPQGITSRADQGLNP